MPSLVGNLVVALGRGRSRLPAPPWLALLVVPVSAKAVFFFFWHLAGNDAGLTWDFYTKRSVNSNRGNRKKKRDFPLVRSRSQSQTHRCVERAMARVIQTRRAAAASAAANEMSPKKKLLLKALAILLGVLLIVSGCGLLVLMGETSAPSLPPSASDLHDLANPDPPLHPPPHTHADVEEKKNALTNSAFGTAWLAINKGNPILQPMVFNFSFLGEPPPLPRQNVRTSR